jgi:phage-related protein
LSPKEQAKMQSVIRTTEEIGLQAAIKLQLVKKIDDNLYELRSRQGNNYQRGLYFHVIQNEYVITHGFSKKTNKTPKKKIRHALTLRAEYYARFRKENQ